MIFEAGAGAFGARPSLKELKKANCVNIITALRHRRGIRWLIRFQMLCCDPGGARLIPIGAHRIHSLGIQNAG